MATKMVRVPQELYGRASALAEEHRISLGEALERMAMERGEEQDDSEGGAADPVVGLAVATQLEELEAWLNTRLDRLLEGQDVLLQGQAGLENGQRQVFAGVLGSLAGQQQLAQAVKAHGYTQATLAAIEEALVANGLHRDARPILTALSAQLVDEDAPEVDYRVFAGELEAGA